MNHSRNGIKLTNIAITNIQTIEQFEYCRQFCSVDQEDKIEQWEIDEFLNEGSTVCFDNGADDINFYFWNNDKDIEFLKNCTTYTFNEFKKHVESLKFESKTTIPSDTKVRLYIATLTEFFKDFNNKETSNTEELFCSDSIKGLADLIITEKKLPQSEKDKLVITTKLVSEEEYRNLPDYNG